jgi:hypothetical protein
MVLTVSMVHKGRKVKKVTRVMWDHKGLKDLPEPMVLTVTMAHNERKRVL